MSNKFQIDKLPLSVHQEFLANLSEFPRWSIEDHTVWLMGQGYHISRSALGRYVK